MIKTLIMAGGKGTRFWPVSTESKPKQYTNLFSDKSLLQDTISRITNISSREDRYIVTVKNQLSLATEQTSNFLDKKNIILEPEGRNTAPCIFYGLLKLLNDGHDENSIVAVLPSDHVILDHQGFEKTLLSASVLARENNKIVTIGITPDTPHTGYGYIQKGSVIGSGNEVKSFREKPSLDIAEEYLSSGDYLWNAGMFIAPISLLLDEFKTHAPEYHEYRDQIENAFGDEHELASIYQKLPKDSIDYAIMEKSGNVAVVAAAFDWNDLGSWDALEDVLEKVDGNILASKNSFRQIEANGNIVFAPEKNVSLIGVSDLVIVSSGDQLMILPKKLAQRVKELSL